MKYITGTLLLAAAVVAAPTAQPVERDGDMAPVAEAFANTFRTFIGRSEEDVAKWLSKGEKVTTETNESAAKWKRDAVDAGDDAAHALAVTKRGLYVRRAAAEDEDFWKSENSKADELAKKAMKLKREAGELAGVAEEARDAFIALLKRSPAASGEEISAAEERSASTASAAENTARDAEAANQEAAESYATVAYALKVRASPYDIETFVKRDQMNAEVAMSQERRVKRESFFASKAARRREALHERAVKLRGEFE
ncbi:hypothetical protein M409DRAFT_56239 [Zasmidium cellare ATCC 36951]|uniref:Uncharacterized protein n=1 Tax=Zasmidium cellare ATCC 36951 TaxID=1080233 RepID=A0A6A6CCW0_ZASCE|nr:uncharacterized protein M409DRAFT_56239 [Zasmidium cellare ATCC 36951]KAF2164881.1 hypothetical protein M409DRAFT_56239 [Zasmidium cellare ATCC 36951]